MTVTADTILMEMSDPQAQQNALEAQSQLKGAEADYDNLKAQLDSQLLTQQGQVTSAQSESDQAKLQEEAQTKLFKDKLVPEINEKLALLKSEQLAKQARIEVERYEKSKRSAGAQLAAQRARVEQMRAELEARGRVA